MKQGGQEWGWETICEGREDHGDMGMDINKTDPITLASVQVLNLPVLKHPIIFTHKSFGNHML